MGTRLKPDATVSDTAAPSSRRAPESGEDPSTVSPARPESTAVTEPSARPASASARIASASVENARSGTSTWTTAGGLQAGGLDGVGGSACVSAVDGGAASGEDGGPGTGTAGELAATKAMIAETMRTSPPPESQAPSLLRPRRAGVRGVAPSCWAEAPRCSVAPRCVVARRCTVARPAGGCRAGTLVLPSTRVTLSSLGGCARSRGGGGDAETRVARVLPSTMGAAQDDAIDAWTDTRIGGGGEPVAGV